MKIDKGAVNQSIYFKLINSTTGLEETGYTITNLTISYVRDRSARVGSSASALGAVDAAHTDYGAIEVDSTNCPGLYRVDIPDAAFAGGVDRVQLCVSGAGITNSVIEAELQNTGIWKTAF